MRILITGASGMLGATLAKRLRDGFDVYATGTGDFEGNPARNFLAFDLRSPSFAPLLDWARPDAIIHCAALTQVDSCERNPEQAYAVNGESVAKFLLAAPSARMIFISTDAVFSGARHMAAEGDAIAPTSVYGKSKAMAERLLAERGGPHAAVRTTLVGANLNPAKQSFAEWIVRSGRDRREIALFADVLFSPISVWHLADELEWILAHPVPGLIHVAGSEAVSKHAFGLALCAALGLDPGFIRKGSIDDSPLLAKRSKDQTLATSLYESVSRRPLPGLAATVAALAEHFGEGKP